jgi:hypothetical protein
MPRPTDLGALFGLKVREKQSRIPSSLALGRHYLKFRGLSSFLAYGLVVFAASSLTGCVFGPEGGNPTTTAGPTSSDASFSSSSTGIRFSINDELGQDQLFESVSISIDGSRVGDLTVDTNSPNDSIDVEVSSPGTYQYQLQSMATLSINGEEKQIPGNGAGTISVSGGESFSIVGSLSGSQMTLELK